MMAEPPVLYEEDGSLAYITFNRPEKLNTLNRELLQAFEESVDHANASEGVRCLILRGAGRAFSGGYDLNPTGQAVAPLANRPARRWDPVRDYQGMSQNVRRFMKLWESPKPVIAQVHGWCVGGGTDLALCSDLIFMAEDAYIGYPPARVYGTPTSMMWVYRLGLEAAKRFMLTGDAIDARTAYRIGLVSEIAPAAELPGIVERFARRFEHIPANQLALNKLLINQAFENMGLRTTQMFGTFFDGMTRNTQEAIDWRDSFSTLGFRETIRRRDASFGDYGERPRP
jgi:enoyl-CoA hydratase